MRRAMAAGAGLVAGLTAAAPLQAQGLAHVSNTFTFNVSAPLERAVRLFGPEGERAWAGDKWNPEFLFPLPASDVEGAVFTVRHGAHTSVWVNTAFDAAAGHVQYAYFLDDLLVTTIDLRLHAVDGAHTRVEVTYARTALRPEANEHVEQMGQDDRAQGKVWGDAIDAYLRR
jgi:hypothetical protein